MLNWHRVERNAQHCRAGDLLCGLLRVCCLARVWSTMLNRSWWSTKLDTEAGDLLDHPFGALCSTKFDRSAMLYCHTAERLAPRCRVGDLLDGLPGAHCSTGV